MASDISYGSIIIFNNDNNTKWKNQIQEKIKFGIHECSETIGAIFSGLSAETFYITNNLDISNNLFIGENLTIQNNITTTDISANILNAINNQQFVDISNNYNDKYNLHNNSKNKNSEDYNLLKSRIDDLKNKITTLMNKSVQIHGI